MTKGQGHDIFPSPEEKTMVRLWKAHGTRLITEMHKVLDARPFTLVHGDMRADNIFVNKSGALDFKFIDWQT